MGCLCDIPDQKLLLCLQFCFVAPSFSVQKYKYSGAKPHTLDIFYITETNNITTANNVKNIQKWKLMETTNMAEILIQYYMSANPSLGFKCTQFIFTDNLMPYHIFSICRQGRSGIFWAIVQICFSLGWTSLLPDIINAQIRIG